MSQPFEVSVAGCSELQDAITRFAREARHDSPSGWMQGVRLAASFIAQSLSSRTAQAKPKHPKFRLANEADIYEIGELHGMTSAQIEVAKHAVMGANGSGAYVGERGFRDYRGPYKPDVWISRDPKFNSNGAGVTIRELNKRWAYQYAGLAKAAWLTMRQQSQRVPKMGTFRDKIAAVLPKVAVVWVRPENLSIHFHNKLSYANKATSQTAINEAVQAGTARLVGYTEQQIQKLKEKHGL